MMQRIRRWGVGSLLLAVTLGVFGSIARGDDEEPVIEKIQKIRIAVTAAPNKHWVGIHAVPADAALKAQLKLDKCLVVQQVVSDSPAEKAGIEQYDVLLKFGDSELDDVEGLIEVVGKNEDKEATVTIIRAGERKTIQVKPEERTEKEITIDVDGSDEAVVHRWMQRQGSNLLKSDGPVRGLFVGPGVLQAEVTKFPSDLSVAIKKTGDNPARIVVERKDDRWEVTDEKLDELPDDIRPHVARLLGRERAFAIGIGTNKTPMRIHTEMRRLNLNSGAIEESIEELHEELMDKDSMKQLREQMNQLRKEMQKLKDLHEHADHDEDN